MRSYKKFVEELVNADIYSIKEECVTINNDKPIFYKRDYEKVKEGKPIYFELDKSGRSSGAIAIVSKNTIPLIVTEDLKYLDSYDWTENLNGKYVYERCHIIAYRLSAELTDKRNIFIGTEHLNTSIMKTIEGEIYNDIEKNSSRILYRVTVKYKDNNQIPTGILIEAQSEDGKFSRCRFCYNIQSEVKINYKNGDILEDKRKEEKKESKIKDNKSNKKEVKGDLENYILNTKTMEYHVKKDCTKLKKVAAKYIQETTTTKSELEKVKLKPCEKCCN